MVSFRNTKSSRLFSESKELSPRRVVRQPPLMWLPNIEFKRRHRPDWLVDRAANCLILQPVICRNKNWLLRKSPAVSMNEDEEVDADDLASQVETDRTRQKMRRDFAKFRRRLQERVQLLLSEKKKDLCISLSFISIVFAHENNWLCLGIFSSRKICRKPTGQNTAGSFLILEVTQLNAGNTRSREV